MSIKTISILMMSLCFSCNNQAGSAKADKKLNIPSRENPYSHIREIPLPNGYTRINAETHSYGEFLRKIDLKKDKTVYTYSGIPKKNQAAQFAILNISVGKKDLQQCADAVMRLRAEYLYEQKLYAQINFIDNNKKNYPFTPPYSRDHFNRYLEQVFGMCGSASLARQLKKVSSLAAMKIGDVFIRGGFPGHAVQVMDMAMNEKGEKIYLLAQSYMPAQDIHVLINENNDELSPWYKINDEIKIYTPEYTFIQNELKSW